MGFNLHTCSYLSEGDEAGYLILCVSVVPNGLTVFLWPSLILS